MRPARAGAGGEGLRPVFVGDLSAASRSSAADPRMGLSVSDCGVRLAQRNRKSPSWFYGMGYWTRSNAEICLLATKGKPKRQSAGVHQFLISPIEQHSKKPDAAREKIVALMGDLPRIELFARQKTPGWDIWGNELPNSIEM